MRGVHVPSESAGAAEICRAGVTSGASAAAELCLAAVEAEPSGKDGRFSTWNDVRPLPQDVELAVSAA